MNLAERLVQLDRESQKRILIIGDSMTDVYVQGRIEQCQEGCPKFVEESKVLVAGGAANARRSLQHWNARTWLGMDKSYGPRKTRFMVSDQCVFRYDDDNVQSVDFELLRKESLKALQDWKPSAVLLSDYDKGMLTPSFICKIVEKCHTQSIPCVADAKRHPEIYHGTIIKANCWWQGRYSTIENQIDPPWVFTHGHLLPHVRDKNDSEFMFTMLPLVNCLNHVGAGDCFAAHLTLALAHRLSLKEAAVIAHSAGRVYVQHRHNEPPHPSEIVRDMASVD